MTKKLPVGSIIEFKGNKDKFMIVGKDVKKDNTIYDYVYANDESVVLLWHLGNIN